MNLLRRIFMPPSIEDSARHMNEWKALDRRERVKARARLIREELGLPPLAALESPRGRRA
jgi:hypothetical protein